MPGDILDVIDGALRDNTVSGDAMRWRPEPEAPEAREDHADDGAAVLASIDLSGFMEAMREAGEALLRFGTTVWKALGQFLPLAPCVIGHERQRDRARCRRCNPKGNPRPLAVNGHEYTKRQRARRRRRRN